MVNFRIRFKNGQNALEANKLSYVFVVFQNVYRPLGQWEEMYVDRVCSLCCIEIYVNTASCVI